MSKQQPYFHALRLADGRFACIELPARSVRRGPDGEVELRPSAVKLLDRLRVMAHEVPDEPSPGWVRTLREALGLTQATLARRIGVDRLSVSRWECGRGRPGADALAKLRRLRRRAVQAGVLVGT
jgi:DNA-binding transcriptional regulator YiaG